jgi:hypothetical protein
MTNYKKIPEKEDKNDVERQIRMIHRLAVRLPWLVVIVVVLVAILTLIEAFLGKG